MMKRVMHIPPDNEFIEKFGVEAFNKKWNVPEGGHFLPDVCYEDGSPVIYEKELILRVGKRRWLKVIDET